MINHYVNISVIAQCMLHVKSGTESVPAQKLCHHRQALSMACGKNDTTFMHFKNFSLMLSHFYSLIFNIHDYQWSPAISKYKQPTVSEVLQLQLK